MLLGVAPDCCDRISQLLPHVVGFAVAVKLTLAPVLLVIASVCAAGGVVPIWKPNEKCPGLTSIAGVPAIVTSTGRLIPVVPGALMATTALNGPAPVSDPGLTVTCSWPESGEPVRFPDTGDTVSQFPPSLVIGVAVKLVTLELLLETVIVFEMGSVGLAGKPKLSDVGFADRTLDAPDEFALRMIGTARNDPADEMLRNPTSVPDAGALAPTETVSKSGVVPLVGLTVNQLLLEKAFTVTLVGPFEDESSRAC
jgi:hypothetical protein